MKYTDREYILLFANHLNSEAGVPEESYFKSPEDAISWMDKAIKKKWLDPEELLLKKGEQHEGRMEESTQ